MKIYVIYRGLKKNLKKERLFREDSDIVAISTNKEKAKEQVKMFNYNARLTKYNSRLKYKEIKLEENMFYLKGVNL